MSKMTSELELRRKRIRVRCWSRGTRETTLLLGRFADQCADRLSIRQIERLEALLDEDDIDLYNWLSGQIVAPNRYSAVLTAIQATIPIKI